MQGAMLTKKTPCFYPAGLPYRASAPFCPHIVDSCFQLLSFVPHHSLLFDPIPQQNILCLFQTCCICCIFTFSFPVFHAVKCTTAFMLSLSFLPCFSVPAGGTNIFVILHKCHSVHKKKRGILPLFYPYSISSPLKIRSNTSASMVSWRSRYSATAVRRSLQSVRIASQRT